MRPHGFCANMPSRSPSQESPRYSQQPLYGPVHSIEDRQLPPLPLQPTAHHNATFFHGVQALLPQRADSERHNDYRRMITPLNQQSLPTRQLPHELSAASQTPRPVYENPAPPFPRYTPQSPQISARSTQSASPTVTRSQSSKQGRRPQLNRSASATQQVCTEPGCPHSDKVFSTFGNLQRHRREKHSVDPHIYACPRGCGATFTRPTARENHVKNDRCKPVLSGRRYDTDAGPSRRAYQ